MKRVLLTVMALTLSITNVAKATNGEQNLRVLAEEIVYTAESIDEVARRENLSKSEKEKLESRVREVQAEHQDGQISLIGATRPYSQDDAELAIARSEIEGLAGRKLTEAEEHSLQNRVSKLPKVAKKKQNSKLPVESESLYTHIMRDIIEGRPGKEPHSHDFSMLTSGIEGIFSDITEGRDGKSSKSAARLSSDTKVVIYDAKDLKNSAGKR